MNRKNFLRKATGEFYTPNFVVDYIVSKVIIQLERDERILKDSFVNFKDSMIKLSFCDPSVGTGNFLLGLFKWFWKELRNFEEIKPQEKESLFISFVNSNVYGVDINQNSLEICTNRIMHEYPFLSPENLSNLRIGNSIVSLDAQQILGKCEARKLHPFSWEKNILGKKKFDVIFGNPPYYNLKKMGLKDEKTRLLFNYLKSSKEWKNYFRASSDIYYYFIIRALNLIEKNGFLSFIIPNYWLHNKYADLLREFLLQYQIQEILDLGEINIFKDEGKWLNVSTCILTCKKAEFKENIQVIKNVPRNFFYKPINQKSLKKYSFYVQQANLGREKWLLSPYLQKIMKIKRNENLVQLGEIAKIIQGVSPGLKSIFVLSRQDIKKNEIEEEVLVPFITNKDIKRWVIQSLTEKYSILPSRIKQLEDYPNTQKYLLDHKKKLEVGPDRIKLINSGKIRWFDYSVYRNLKQFESTRIKIMTPYRGSNPKFGLDEKGYFGATDVYGIIPNDKKDIYPLLGILNSQIISFWYREAGKMKGKLMEFFSDPLNKIPIPNKRKRRTLIPYVKEIMNLVTEEHSNKNSIMKKKIYNLNKIISEMYEIDYDFIHQYDKNTT